MNEFKNIENVFFIGAGGIGMSALERYFLAGGFNIGGYDKTSTFLTGELIEEGCIIQFEDSTDKLPDKFKNQDNTMVVYTPAIPAHNNLFKYFTDGGSKYLKELRFLVL